MSNKNFNLDECSILTLSQTGHDVFICVDDVFDEPNFPWKCAKIHFSGVKNISVNGSGMTPPLSMKANDGEAIVFRIGLSSVEILVEWINWQATEKTKKKVGSDLIKFGFESINFNESRNCED